MSPCYACIDANCSKCPHRSYANPNFKITDKEIENIWRESADIVFIEDDDGQLVLDQPWRGFPVGEFTQDDLFYWVDAHHSKGVGWVYENISC
mgnify:FL=1